LAAAQELSELGISVTVADARFCKPLDTELIEGLARHHALVATVEDGAAGGFSAHVLHHLAARDLLARTRFRAFTLPDRFIAHGSPAEQYQDAGLDTRGLVEGIRESLGRAA
jgi:1-deoxy-D-xylulose-5-phosphate synthase